MAEVEQVMIYATGSDMDLRRMAWALLGAGLVSQADLLDRGRIYLKNGDKPKVGASGRAVALFCARADLDRVMAMMKASYHNDDLAAYALPVLARL